MVAFSIYSNILNRLKETEAADFNFSVFTFFDVVRFRLSIGLLTINPCPAENGVIIFFKILQASYKTV